MSGKVFGTEAQPIDATMAPIVQQKIMNDIRAKYPDIVLLGLGSVSKKTEPSGDIDIGVKCKDIKELENIVDDVFGYLDTKNIESYYIISIKYPYKDTNNETKYVACDFIQVVDETYTKFRYECPDYIKNESNYKTGMKIMFVSMLLNHTQEKNDGVPEGYYGKFDFSPIGLYRYTININNMKDFKYEFVTLDTNKIIHMLFNEKGSWKDFHSVETLWEAIHSDKFKYPERLRYIELKWFINSYRKGWYSVQPEDFKLRYWTAKSMQPFLRKEKLLQKINNILKNGKEI